MVQNQYVDLRVTTLPWAARKYKDWPKYLFIWRSGACDEYGVTMSFVTDSIIYDSQLGERFDFERLSWDRNRIVYSFVHPDYNNMAELVKRMDRCDPPPASCYNISINPRRESNA